MITYKHFLHHYNQENLYFKNNSYKKLAKLQLKMYKDILNQ
jgi:hypothetical protein